VAELTHRCPLGCPYCCNPLALDPPESELDAATWARVFLEAVALGIGDVHLSGGEPGARRDLVEIAASAREAGLVVRLVTSGYGISTRTLRDLWEAGLHEVEVSFQDSDAVVADRIANRRGAFQRKYALAVEAVRLGLPLTVGVVVHRANIDRVEAMVALALELKATRIELVPVRQRGWALKNSALLASEPAQVVRAAEQVRELRRRHGGGLAIEGAALGADASGAPDECSRDCIHVTPSGRVLPCAGAEEIPGLEFWSVREHPLGQIWALSPAFKAVRVAGGCRSHSGPRLAAATPTSDGAGHRQPHHALVMAHAEAPEDWPYVHRRL
jgi:pyrroloquinoline quinone biosynthesis protein E